MGRSYWPGDGSTTRSPPCARLDCPTGDEQSAESLPQDGQTVLVPILEAWLGPLLVQSARDEGLTSHAMHNEPSGMHGLSTEVRGGPEPTLAWFAPLKAQIRPGPSSTGATLRRPVTRSTPSKARRFRKPDTVSTSMEVYCAVRLAEEGRCPHPCPGRQPGQTSPNCMIAAGKHEPPAEFPRT